ncbi:MAG: LTA synthase family protein [Lachnospiraceae bacterium]|nr:LTA synthase family protein [Lachnospiraceae bacterium]
MKPIYLLYNYLIWFLAGAFLLCLFPFPAMGVTLLLAFAVIFGIANYFIIRFRRSPITPSDLLAIGTAAAVSDAYDITPPFRCILAAAAAILLSVLSFVLNFKAILLPFPKSWIVRLVLAALLLVLMFFILQKTDLKKLVNIQPKPYRAILQSESYGFLLMFLIELQKLMIPTPGGYKRYKVKTRLRHFDELAEAAENENPSKYQVQPSLITIMNESFSDLSVLGPFPPASRDLAFFKALKNDKGTLLTGWTFVSTRGGGTARTEFEYLTGNSMAFVPGSIPYLQYDFRNRPSMPKELSKQGYRTIAMHPENRSNWRRDKVYAAMGFEHFYDISAYPEAREMIYGHTDDRSNYEELLRVLEKNTDPVFIFNVTMQNHGSYDLEAMKHAKKEIVEMEKEFKRYRDVTAFESLMKASDDALRFLVKSLRKIKRPVILTFFGDHQPALDGDFEAFLEAKGRYPDEADSIALGENYFKVPFVIWTNSPAFYRRDKDLDDPIAFLSPNFLGAQTTRFAKIRRSAMDLYLDGLNEQILAMNETGFLADDGEWHAYDKPGEYSALLNGYECIQYYRMFEKKK